MDESGLLGLFRWPGAPLWVIALMSGVLAFKTWPFILERMNERYRDRAATRGQDWTRLREEIDRYSVRLATVEGICDELRLKVRECEDDRTHWMNRAIKAEAALQGMGEVRQAAANAAAEVRIDAAEKERKDKKP